MASAIGLRSKFLTKRKESEAKARAEAQTIRLKHKQQPGPENDNHGKKIDDHCKGDMIYTRKWAPRQQPSNSRPVCTDPANCNKPGPLRDELSEVAWVRCFGRCESSYRMWFGDELRLSGRVVWGELRVMSWVRRTGAKCVGMEMAPRMLIWGSKLGEGLRVDFLYERLALRALAGTVRGACAAGPFVAMWTVEALCACQCAFEFGLCVLKCMLALSTNFLRGNDATGLPVQMWHMGDTCAAKIFIACSFIGGPASAGCSCASYCYF